MDHRGNETEAGYIDQSEISKPGANPALGYLRIYAKSDDNLYSLTHGGVETKIGSGGGGGGLSVPSMVQSQIGIGNSQNPTLFTFGSAPVSGHAVVVGLNMSGRGATTLSSTNTTWTKIHSYNDGASVYEVWVGIVSGTGGTAVSMTSGSSNFWSALGMEITDVLTPTQGANLEASVNGAPGTSASLSTTAGRLVAFLLGCDNTTNQSFMVPNIPFIQADITGHGNLGTVLCLGYAPTGKVQANYIALPSTGGLVICEIT